MKFRCVQLGHECRFEAKKRPTHCPVCKYPFAGEAVGDVQDCPGDELPWSEYTGAELLEYCDSWGVDMPDKRPPKAALISALEAV